jgi:hypothetical protein
MKTRILIYAGIAAGVLYALAYTWAKSDLYVGTYGYRAITGSVPVAVSVLMPVALAVALMFAAFFANDTMYYKLRQRNIRRMVVTVCLAALVIPALWFAQGARWMNRYTFETTAPYGANLEEVTGQPPAYGLRLSVPQARLQLRNALQGEQGYIGDVTYVANQDVPEYCATVHRADTLGRVWTKLVICMDPNSGSMRKAAFTGNVGTPEGAWASRLGDQVASVRRGLVFDTPDVYGYITQSGEPRLVVPARSMSSDGNRRFDMPAGVVVFDVDGSRTLHRKLAPGEIPGPVFPMSMAAAVRDSVNTRAGFVAYQRPQRNDQALEATNMSAGSAATDPNAENPSEFVLVREDGRVVYVTPLTPYGTSQTVVAYLEVFADEVSAGQAPAATLYRMPSGSAAASYPLIAQRVTSLYDADVEWMDTNDDTDASNRARIYEITPAQPGQVTLTIGTGTQPLYRVYADAVLNERNTFGTICVHRFSDDVLLRCDTADSDPAPVGSLRGIAASKNPTAAPSGDAPSGRDLSEVPTDELLAELARRIDG